MRRLIFFIGMIAGISCSKNNIAPESNFPSTNQWMITNVDGPHSGNINDSIALTVYWPYGSGCDVLDGFQQTQQGYEVLIKAFGHTNYGFCTQAAGVKTKIFYFYTSSPGRYRLKFLNPDNSYLIYIITIN